ncbi:MAG: hypothetical protein ACRCT1_14805 [Microcoleaceae cyanobacterium]
MVLTSLLNNGMVAILKFSQPSHYDRNYPSIPSRCQGVLLLLIAIFGKFL